MGETGLKGAAVCEQDAEGVVRIIRDPGGDHIRGADGKVLALDHQPGRRSLMRHVLLAAALLALAACVSRPSVDVALIGLAPMESTLLEQRLRLDFRLQNFGERALDATGLELTLYVNGRRLARGVDNRGFHIDRLGETTASAVVSTSLFEVARQLLALPEQETFSYELQGRVYLQGWPRSARFSRSGEISRSELARLAGSGDREPQPLRLD